ncbi:MAG: HypC/HybG/HupF family hydrogenase formation chaperone [Elusimicrobiales bacterium]
MCLAVPGKIVRLDGAGAEVDFGGVTRHASVDLVPDAKPGDYVIVHAGYAIQILPQDDARETLRLLKEVYGA